MSKKNSKFKYPEIKFLLLYLMFTPFTPINAGGGGTTTTTNTGNSTIGNTTTGASTATTGASTSTTEVFEPEVAVESPVVDVEAPVVVFPIVEFPELVVVVVPPPPAFIGVNGINIKYNNKNFISGYLNLELFFDMKQ